MRFKNLFSYAVAMVAACSPMLSMAQEATPIWKDHTKSIDERTDDLMSKLTVEEKIRFCGSTIPAVKRLGIESYEWYSEALHGFLGYRCTSFPQNIAMGSTWNRDLMFDVASAISDEARAVCNYQKQEVMIFSPTVNMARDPRWGRNEECYSEDPYHMSQMAKMYVRGMQGTHPKYLKTVCTVKHYVANNVEHKRTQIHSNVGERDLRDYYFPAYKACVVEERAGGIMTGLNGLNGIPCSSHDWLINKVLRDQWGFEGYVIADWGAVGGVHFNLHAAKSNAEAAVMALRAGCDQECIRPQAAFMVLGLLEAYKNGDVTEAEIDVAVRRLVKLRFMVGGFGVELDNPYINIPKSVMECDDHKALARKAAEQAVVLLKNEGNTLPLSDNKSQKIAVVGPFADRCWLGIYSGTPQSRVSPLQGIESRFGGEVIYAQGCAVTEKNDKVDMSEAINAAKSADVVIAFVGNDDSTSTEGNDRESLTLPGRQQQLLDELCKVNKKVVVVLVPSGSTTIGAAQKNAEAIVCAWANGQEQGHAIAGVLFGDVNPSGKVNTTWYASDSDLPDLHDYNIRNNRTYMYFKGKPLYPYGYGLSYTSYEYSDLKVSTSKVAKDGSVEVSFTVKNTGKMDGDEITQLYIRNGAWKKEKAARKLRGFERVSVKSGESKRVTIKLDYEAFSQWAGKGDTFEVCAGEYTLEVGSSSEAIHLSQKITVEGGMLPEHSLRTQSYADYNSNPRYRSKEYEKIVTEDTVIERVDNQRWIEFEAIFTDPGYYVSEWEIDVNYSLPAGKRRKFSISIDDMIIDSYFVQPSEGEMRRVRIPKPDYSVPIAIKVIAGGGDFKINYLELINPEDGSRVRVDKVLRKNRY